MQEPCYQPMESPLRKDPVIPLKNQSVERAVPQCANTSQRKRDRPNKSYPLLPTLPICLLHYRRSLLLWVLKALIQFYSYPPLMQGMDDPLILMPKDDYGDLIRMSWPRNLWHRPNNQVVYQGNMMFQSNYKQETRRDTLKIACI